MWKFAAYLAAGLAGLALFGAGAKLFVHTYVDATACDNCRGDSLKTMPEASLLPDGAKLLDAYSVDSSEVSDADPGYIREVETNHTAAAVTGYYDQQLAKLGWSRLRAGEATAKAGIAGINTNRVTWAKGDLRFDVAFPPGIVPGGGTAPQRITVTLSRLQ